MISSYYQPVKIITSLIWTHDLSLWNGKFTTKLKLSVILQCHTEKDMVYIHNTSTCCVMLGQSKRCASVWHCVCALHIWKLYAILYGCYGMLHGMLYTILYAKLSTISFSITHSAASSTAAANWLCFKVSAPLPVLLYWVHSSTCFCLISFASSTQIVMRNSLP